MSWASLTQATPASIRRAICLAAVGVAGPDRRLQPVAAVVGERDRLLGVGDAHHRQRRPEGLLGHAEHRVVDAGQHGRLVEAARALADPAPGPDLGAALDRVADVGVDQLELRREDDRADVDGAELAGRALAQRLDLRSVSRSTNSSWTASST